MCVCSVKHNMWSVSIARLETTINQSRCVRANSVAPLVSNNTAPTRTPTSSHYSCRQQQMQRASNNTLPRLSSLFSNVVLVSATVGACSDTSLAPCHAYQAQCQDGRAECSCLSQVAQCYATKGCMLSGVVQNACVEAGCGSECNPTGSAIDTTTTISNGRATPGPSTSSPSSGPSSTATSDDVQPSPPTLTETTETTEATSVVAESSSVARVFVNVVLCGALLLTFV